MRTYTYPYILSMLISCNIFAFLVITLSPALVGASPDPIAKKQNESGVQKKMHQATLHFNKLQKFLADKSAFESETNKQEVLDTIEGLKETFLEVKELDSTLHKQAGFTEQAKAIAKVLDDASFLYQMRNIGTAYNQLRTVSNNCISCHSTFNVDKRYKNAHTFDPSLGEYYLATRQLSKAKDAFYKKALESTSSFERIDALKRWILIFTRIESNPKKILPLLHKVRKLTTLTEYEVEMLDGWHDSLVSWSKEAPPKMSKLLVAENLIEKASLKEDFIYESVGTIEYLRASALLHQVLANPDITADTKKRALYVLGFTYVKVPGYLINELPDIYLIRCIEEFPGSKEAKSSYKLYALVARQRYEQAGRKKAPPEVWARLQELQNTAYGKILGAM